MAPRLTDTPPRACPKARHRAVPRDFSPPKYISMDAVVPQWTGERPRKPSSDAPRCAPRKIALPRGASRSRLKARPESPPRHRPHTRPLSSLPVAVPCASLAAASGGAPIFQRRISLSHDEHPEVVELATLWTIENSLDKSTSFYELVDAAAAARTVADAEHERRRLADFIQNEVKRFRASSGDPDAFPPFHYVYEVLATQGPGYHDLSHPVTVRALRDAGYTYTTDAEARAEQETAARSEFAARVVERRVFVAAISPDGRRMRAFDLLNADAPRRELATRAVPYVKAGTPGAPAADGVCCVICGAAGVLRYTCPKTAILTMGSAPDRPGATEAPRTYMPQTFEVCLACCMQYECEFLPPGKAARASQSVQRQTQAPPVTQTHG
jgi:hypothetical protein